MSQPLPHQVETRAEDGLRCTICRREFKKEPWGNCPGVPQYDWDPWPDGLFTAKQLAKERLIPGPVAGAIYYPKAAGGWLWLYRKEDATPKPALSEARQAGIAKAKETRRRNRTCRMCGTYVPSDRCEEWIDSSGHCRPCGVRCWTRKQLQRECVILDLETTGLDRDAEIIQIGVVDHTGAVLLDTFVRPRHPIVEREYEDGDDQDNWDEPRRTAFGVNGITNAMVAAAPTFPEIYPQLRDLLANRVVVAWNRSFENEQVDTHLHRYELPEIEVRYWTCAMAAYAEFYGDYSRKYGDFKYQALWRACSQMGVTELPTHQGAADCLATLAVLRALARDPEPRKETHE